MVRTMTSAFSCHLTTMSAEIAGRFVRYWGWEKGGGIMDIHAGCSHMAPFG